MGPKRKKAVLDECEKQFIKFQNSLQLDLMLDLLNHAEGKIIILRNCLLKLQEDLNQKEASIEEDISFLNQIVDCVTKKALDFAIDRYGSIISGEQEVAKSWRTISENSKKFGIPTSECYLIWKRALWGY